MPVDPVELLELFVPLVPVVELVDDDDALLEVETELELELELELVIEADVELLAEVEVLPVVALELPGVPVDALTVEATPVVEVLVVFALEPFVLLELLFVSPQADTTTARTRAKWRMDRLSRDCRMSCLARPKARLVSAHQDNSSHSDDPDRGQTMGLTDRLKQFVKKQGGAAEEEESILQELIRPESLTHIVDIGANPIDGAPPYQAMLSRGLCRVTGFEPQPAALAALEKVKGPHEKYLPDAVGDGKSHTLRQCKGSGMSSLFAPEPRVLSLFPFLADLAKVESEISVQTRRLDDIAELDRMDFLKIDIQGAELSVFQGGVEKLKAVVGLQTEVSFLPLYRGQPVFGEVDLELRKQGFIPHSFVGVKHWPIAPFAYDEDALKPIRQVLEADVVYIRDITQPEMLSVEQWKHLAMIAEQVYRSYDLVVRCLKNLEQRKAIESARIARYVDWLRAKGVLATAG